MLKHLKVIDAASYVAGPAAATVLGDYGANVIKVEPPSGDTYRRLAARYRVDYNWLLTSRNKRGLALDIAKPEGQEALHKLIAGADVLIVNFNAGQLKKYQLEYETLKTINPKLIFAHITGYGTRGPDAGRRAFDVAAWWARSGIMDMMKPPGGRPTNGVGGVGDHASAMSLFGAIMMALYQRERTGEGAYVATSLAANGAWSNGMHLQAAIAGFDLSEILEEKGYQSPFNFPYETREGRYVMLVGPDPGREWPRLCEAFGHPEWLQDDRFQGMKAIMKNRDLVREYFTEYFASTYLADAVKSLDKVDATYSVVEKLKDVLSDAHLIENEVIVKTGIDEADYQWTVNSPIEMAGVSKREIARAPAIGEHSVQILQEAGFTEAEIKALGEAGIMGKGD